MSGSMPCVLCRHLCLSQQLIIQRADATCGQVVVLARCLLRLCTEEETVTIACVFVRRGLGVSAVQTRAHVTALISALKFSKHGEYIQSPGGFVADNTLSHSVDGNGWGLFLEALAVFGAQ